MKKPTTLFQFLAFLIGVLFLLLPCHAEKIDSIQYNPVSGRSAGVNSASSFLGNRYASWSINLPQVQADLTSAASGIIKSGVVFPLTSPITALQLPWEPVSSGYAARVHVSSGQAKRLRFHLAITNELKSIRFLVQGNLDASPIGPIGDSAIHGNGIWLPVTNGNNADLEIFVGGEAQLDKLDFKIDSINLIISDFSRGEATGFVAQSLGYTSYKEYDLACWSNSPSYLGLSQAASATAKVNFIDNGGSFICTGTLLNDKGNTNTPWFVTANHCLPNQATANTASFEWFFQATSCGGKIRDPRYAQTYGGALLLYTDFKLEPSFLKLNQQPPVGVTFIGFDTNIHVGDSVWAVHHPKGDHTMVSQGTVESLLQTVTDATQGGTHLLDEVTFLYGGTEGGSSGSGLFSISNGSSHWHGTLFGGPQDNYQMAGYSHLQSYYDNIKQWLGGISAPSPPGISFTASQTTVNYLASTTLNWSATNAVSCSATTSDGWSGNVETTGSIALTMNLSTTYTLSCIGAGGQATQLLTVNVNPPLPEKIACLFDWAERGYPNLFSPAPAVTQFLSPYTYRYYLNTNAYVGVSSLNNHVYYLRSDGVLQDEGQLSVWLVISSCQ